MGSGSLPVCAGEDHPYMHHMQRATVGEIQAAPRTAVRAAHRANWIRHAVVCLMISVAVLVVIRWWAWAWAPSCIIGILYLMYASIEMAESRSRALRDGSVHGPRPNTHAMLVERERIGARILSTLVIGTLAMALVVAALVLDLPTLGMGTAMTFGVVVFVGLPTWAAVVGDAVPQGRR
jgi:hypothetical protein